MLLPIEFSDRFNKARARSHGEFVDKNEWEKHPFDDVGNDRVSNKDEDRMASSSSSLVHGESKVREDGHINDPYGFQGTAHAEVCACHLSWRSADCLSDSCLFRQLS